VSSKPVRDHVPLPLCDHRHPCGLDSHCSEEVRLCVYPRCRLTSSWPRHVEGCSQLRHLSPHGLLSPRHLQKKVIVAKLSAIEELAGMTILCSDNTGTLTLDKLSLREPIGPARWHDACNITFYAALASKREARIGRDRFLSRAAQSHLLKNKCCFERLRAHVPCCPPTAGGPAHPARVPRGALRPVRPDG